MQVMTIVKQAFRLHTQKPCMTSQTVHVNSIPKELTQGNIQNRIMIGVCNMNAYADSGGSCCRENLIRIKTYMQLIST